VEALREMYGPRESRINWTAELIGFMVATVVNLYSTESRGTLIWGMELSEFFSSIMTEGGD
jgi:hypothetical protein